MNHEEILCYCNGAGSDFLYDADWMQGENTPGSQSYCRKSFNGIVEICKDQNQCKKKVCHFGHIFFLHLQREVPKKPEYIVFPCRLKKSRFILHVEKADFEAHKICLFYAVLPDDGAAPPTPNEILL